MSWLDDYLNFDLKDPKNLPESNVEEKSPFDQSPLGEWYNSNSAPSKDFAERVKDLQSTTYDAAGNIIAPTPKQKQPTPADIAAYNGNLDFLGLGQAQPQAVSEASPEIAKPLPEALVKHLMQKREAASNPIKITAQIPSDKSTNEDIVTEKATAPSLLEKFSPEAYAKAKAEADDRNSGLGWAQFAAGVGNSLARRDPSEVNAQFNQIRERNKDETVGEFNRQKASAVGDIDVKSKIDDNDPNSRKSKMVQETISKLYPGKFSPEAIATLTAKDSELLLKPLELNAKLEENRINNQMKLETIKQSQSDRHNKASSDAYVKARSAMESFRGNAGAQQASKDILAADKALKLVEGKDPNKLTVQDLRLLAEEMGKIASGGVPSEHGVTGLMPNNLQTKYAELKNYLSSSPSDANASEYIQHNLSYLREMKDTAANSLASYRGNIAKGYKGKLSADDYQELQNDYGLNQPQRNTANSSEVERKTKDGKVAIFDGNTKQFLRFK